MNIKVLGAHNRETKTTKCMSLLIDSTLALDAGALTSLSLSEQEKLKAILLTHQHYDHIKDIPMVAIDLYNHGSKVTVYATKEVRRSIETHILNGIVYPEFQQLPRERPTINFKHISPYTVKKLEGYEALPVPVNHYDGTIGYQVSDSAGRKIFYTSDTGPGLTGCWRLLSPQLLIIDVTLPNRFEEFALRSGHLTPRLLGEELTRFRLLKDYLPQIVIVHMDPLFKQEIEEEVARVAEALDTPITVATEGTQLHI